MSEELKHKIYSSSECISEQQMFDYIDNKLSAKEQHLIEKHMLNCNLCSDASEGLELLRERDRIAGINQKINEHISTTSNKKSKIIFFNFKTVASIAAGITLLIGGVFLFNQFAPQKMKEKDVAELNQVSTPPPPVTINTEAAADSDSLNIKQPELITSSTNKLQFERTEKSQQQFALTEEQKSNSYYENPISNGEGITTSNVTTTGDVITKSDNTNEVTIPAESNIPKAGLPEKEKDLLVDETKKAEEKNEDKNFAFLAQTTPAQKNSADNSDMDQKTSKNNRNQKEAKAKDKAAKQVATDDVSGNVGYTQQNVISDQENLKTEPAKPETIAISESDSAITIVDEKPEFPGGETEMMKFILKNFQYSKTDKKEGISNTKIYVQFIIGKTGKIKNAKIVKGISPELDKEALRIISMMPEWKPAKLKGKPVDYKYLLPIQLDFK